MTRLVVLVLLLAQAAAPASMSGRIRRLIRSSPIARGASWGIQIVDVRSGKVLFQENGNRFFVPASNTKLFTTALGLMRLGPDYRFNTTVRADRLPDASGQLAGDLRLVGGGDPNLSARAIPYRMGPNPGNPLQAIEDLADQVVAHGVRRIDGNVVGDDSAYVWEPYPEGWGVDDPIWEYGAPVSALTINDNAFSLIIRPGDREGALARISLCPPLEYYLIDNRVRTTNHGEKKILVDREAGSRQLRVWGAVPIRSHGDTELLGIKDPALYGAMALYDALTRRGVNIAGRPVAHHLFPNQVADLKMGPPPPPPGGVELARRVSAPLLADLQITDKVSQNLHAELLLRAVARTRRNIGSREAGLEEVKAFLEDAGIDPTGYNLNDGSGLTRMNLVSPATVVKLLRYMYLSEQSKNWFSLLPVAGKDGTLHARFSKTPAAGRIHAKTGTLSHVSALSGYAVRRDGRVRAFSILVNNYNGPSSEVRTVIDKIASSIVE